MSRSVNKAMLIGNVGSDPDIRATASGARVAKVSLATSRTFQDRSGATQERTEWHRLTIWGRLVDVVEQWVRKGDRLYVEGRIEYSESQDDRGNTRYWTDINVRELMMLGSGGGGRRDQGAEAGSGGYAPSPGRPAAPITEPDDDLPF